VKGLPSKKQHASKKTVAIIIVSVIVLIVVSSLVALNFGSNVYRIASPPASSFQTQEWMQYLPSDVTAFRFLNISALTMVSGLFNSSTLMNLDSINMSLTPYDIRYGVEIYSSNGSFIHVMALNESFINYIASSLANQSLLHITYHDVQVYYLSAQPTSGDGGSWLCINKGAIIFSGSKNADLQCVMKVIDANDTTFFNSDVLKIGYLLTSNGKNSLIFSYYAWDANSNNVDIEMRSASNSTPFLDVRTSYHFQTQQDFDLGYDYFLTQILSSARSIFVSPTFLIGQYYYNQDRINSLVSAL